MRNPNPAYPIEIPLAKTWWISRRKGNEAWVKAWVDDGRVHYAVQHNAEGPEKSSDGTKGRTSAYSFVDGTPIDLSYIRAEAQAGRMGQHMIAVVAEEGKKHIYCSPDERQRNAACVPRPSAAPVERIDETTGLGAMLRYGFFRWSDIFTSRQLTTLLTFSDVVKEAHERVYADAQAAGNSHPHAYADIVTAYLALVVSKCANRWASTCAWDTKGCHADPAVPYSRVQMTWNFAEVNPFSQATGSYHFVLNQLIGAFSSLPNTFPGHVVQADAATRDYAGYVISTDPPYYDVVDYASLSDFFYVWLRYILKEIIPEAVPTIMTPKDGDLFADPHRYGDKESANAYFVQGFNRVLRRIRETLTSDVPVVLYYTYKQEKVKDKRSTAWVTLLQGLINTGWMVTATWPVRTEHRKSFIPNANTVTSSIILACRPRPEDAPSCFRKDFLQHVRSELDSAVPIMREGNISPIDMKQAAIGVGLSVFSRYRSVRSINGAVMSVLDALSLIGSAIDEMLTDQKTDFDTETRFALTWYESYGWVQETSGIADQLALASNISLDELIAGGAFETKGGYARLLSPEELSGPWNPNDDPHISIWEATIRLAALLDTDGIDAAAHAFSRLIGRISMEAVKNLVYLLRRIADDSSAHKDREFYSRLIDFWDNIESRALEYRRHSHSSRA